MKSFWSNLMVVTHHQSEQRSSVTLHQSSQQQCENVRQELFTNIRAE